MKWYVGLLPYFLVRFLSVKYCERSLYDGFVYYKAVGNDWICMKITKGQQNDK